MRRGKDAQCGCEHLHGGEYTNLFRVHTDVIHREDHDPGVGDSLTKADQDVAQEQPAHWRVEFAQASPKIPPLVDRNLSLRLLAQLALHENGERRKKNGEQGAMRTPPMIPKRSINIPPKTGAIMIGSRLITD